jgi:hypothetical protein
MFLFCGLVGAATQAGGHCTWKKGEKNQKQKLPVTDLQMYIFDKIGCLTSLQGRGPFRKKGEHGQ